MTIEDAIRRLQQMPDKKAKLLVEVHVEGETASVEVSDIGPYGHDVLIRP